MIKLMLLVYLYLMAQMFLVWALYRVSKNPSIVDVSWSIGLMMAGLIYIFSTPLTINNILLFIFLMIWGVRLAAYLWFKRVSKRHIDKRYIKISDDWKINKSLGFFFNFQLQGIFIFIVSLNIYFASHAGPANLTMLTLMASIIVIIGIIGESIADIQLNRFKENHKKMVCNKGLWKYSRHPNYFFDWLTWCGFTLFALNHPAGLISLISPIFLYFIFTHITGPITERVSIQSRGDDYIDYQRKTPMFFPSFIRK